MLDQPLTACLDRAIAQLARGCRDAPESAAALVTWTRRLSPTGEARDYFDGGRAVMLLLPWWLEKRIRPIPDRHFQQLLVESSVNAYYFIRMIDDVMDDDARADRRLLPLLAIFHANFSRAYACLFPPGDVFWEHFEACWSATANAAMREKALAEVALNDFVEVAARKTSGIKIPLAAVCCRYRRLDLLEPWCDFYDKFARWQQMLDDTFDWMRDLRFGNRTFFLSEGNRQRTHEESVSGWVVRRGFTWGVEWLASAMRDLRKDAAQLGSPELLRFLEYREAEVRDHAGELQQRLRRAAVVADAFEPIGEVPKDEG